MRRHRRALSYMFRQFVSASSSVQRLAVITVRDLATTGTVTTVATLIGADIAVTGINQRMYRRLCQSPHGGKDVVVLTTRPLRFGFDFRKS